MDGNGKKGRGRGRGRGRPRGRGRGRGRPKKLVIESDEEEVIETSETVDNMVELETPVEAQVITPDVPPEEAKVEFSLDDDISQLIPPTFSTISTGPPQPMIDLDWNHNYNPFGEKIPNANVHMCVTCRLPIRIYGRLIPCKHVYCYGCAKKEGSHCSQCNEKVHRIEQAHLGTVHMCLHEGARYGFDGCRRTYLSQRDLQAHFNHRHKPRSASSGEAMANLHGALDTPSSYSSRSIPVVHSSRSNLAPVQSQGSGGRSRPDSQSYSGSGGDSRYDRKPYYQRNSWR